LRFRHSTENAVVVLLFAQSAESFQSYFGGLSVEETAEFLQVSPETVMRDWKMARTWLFRELVGKTKT
jgi:DNA-directed RNA polymerase specialized sigma24 family protein